MKVIFIMHLVYGIGNKFFYGCIYRKVKDPHILDELTQYENRYESLPGLKKIGIQAFWIIIFPCDNVTCSLDFLHTW